MKEPDYWQQFLNTGRVDDYLYYKKEDTVSGENGNTVMAGDNPYAGICEINRDGFEDGAYRGIR